MTIAPDRLHTFAAAQPSAARRATPTRPSFDGAAAALRYDAPPSSAGRTRLLPNGDRNSSPAVLARASMGWHQPELTEAEVVQAVVDSVTELVPGAAGAAVLSGPGTGFRCDQAQVLAISSYRQEPAAAAQQAVDQLNDLHLCAQLLETGSVVRERDGWPIATTSAPAGEGMLMWMPLGEGETCGTLLIVVAAAVTDRMEADAVLIAMHAATAISAARQREHLRIAVETRDVIGQAKGILMERLHLTADAAFGLLSRASQDSNIKLRDVCASICDTGDCDDLRPDRRVNDRRRSAKVAVDRSHRRPKGVRR